MLELKSINKWFGKLQANKDICLKVAKGTIHGIVGENGAGKSTLMSILYGFYQADRGEIFVQGKAVKILNSKIAISLGIGMVHQNFMLIDTFNCVENVLLGAEDEFLLAKSLAIVRKKIKNIQSNYKMSISLDLPVAELSVGAKQKVEIFKALYRDAKILILDEPTGVLTPQETRELFHILKTLKKEGVTILLITHKLKEILNITDNVTVMRKGETVQTLKTKDTDAHALAKLMVGRDMRVKRVKKVKIKNRKLLEVKNLNYINDFQTICLQDINFELFAGEILGIAGVSGNGQTELLEILSGMRLLQKGEITVDNALFTSKNFFNSAFARQLGIMHIPEDRLETGLLKEFNAIENNILGYQHDKQILKNKLLQPNIMRKECFDNMNNFDVRPIAPELRLENFSGGNQQKLLFSREMGKKTKIFLVGQPTRGVDIGAIEVIHQKLLEKRNEGKAVLLVSAELDEILALSDRILVICQGKITGELSAKNASAQKIGLLMGDGK